MTTHAEKSVRCVVIGAGVVGCAVTWELAQRGLEPVLLERALDVGEGASKANSAIVHTGFDARPGSIEAEFLARARGLWPALVDDMSLPFLRLGALMLAATDLDLARLQREVGPGAAALGVSVEVMGASELRNLAPYVSGTAVGAMLVPDEAVTDPFWLTRAYAEGALRAGARVRLGVEVVGLEPGRGGVLVRLTDGDALLADQVVNCAGLFADDVAAMAGDDSFGITPRKGQFLVSEEAFGVDRIVLPIPGPMGKGLLVTPIVFGGLLLGPTAVDQADKHDRSTDSATRAALMRACVDLVPALEQVAPVRQFAGLRTVSSSGDYILAPSRRTDRLYHVAGIRSTGISTSPAVAEAVTDEVERLRGWGRRGGRSAAAPPMRLDATDGPQDVVCLCRSVGRVELGAALVGPLPAMTLDGLKRRCGVTFGDCQGNLCSVEVARSLAEARGMPVSEIRRSGRGSWLFAEGSGAAPADASVAARAEPAPPRSGPATERPDLVVIGAGLAGIGAALAGLAAGARTAVIERRPHAGGALVAAGADLDDAEATALEAFRVACGDGRIGLVTDATATGLERSDGGWLVFAQRRHDALDVRAHAVVLATGGYVQPREHLPIDGPRPAGVMTADLVHAALDAGLLPGRRAAIVGDGRLARATRHRLEAAGCRVVLATATLPEGLRGGERISGLLVAGAWHDVDSLVMCERLLPQPFLLRGLGLLDGRAGQPAPTASDGQVDDRLWAAGSCAWPDIDHRASLQGGQRVGSLAAALAARSPA